MNFASILNARSQIFTGSVGVLVIVLALVALVSKIEPPMQNNAGSFASTLPAQESQPSFEIARINENGSAIFSGSATAGSTISLTLNQQPFAEVQTDIHGDWIHTVGSEINVGKHIMRISAKLQGFADSTPDEQLLIDLGGIDSGAVNALPNTQAIIFAASRENGLRILQKPQLVAGLQPNNAATLPKIIDTTVVTEPNTVPVQDAAPVQQEVATPEVAPTPAPKVVESPKPQVAALPADYQDISVNKILLGQDLQTVDMIGGATANALIRANIEGYPIAESRADAMGQWQVQLDMEGASGGAKNLIITQSLNGQELGRRVASLQLPNAPKVVAKATPEKQPAATLKKTTAAAMSTVKVRAGDSLWSLAQRAYNDGRQHKKILDANKDQIKSHKDLKPGMVLKVPK